MEDKGLYPKYKVYKVETGEEVPFCFVLRPLKDESARKAIYAYAEHTPNEILSEELMQWMDEFGDKQCWDKNRAICERVGSKVCCCYCKIRHDCFESNEGKMCGLVESGEVMEIEECYRMEFGSGKEDSK